MEMPAVPVTPVAIKLPSIKNLFVDSFKLFFSNWLKFILVLLLPILALIIGEGLIIALILFISGGDLTSRLLLIIPPVIVGVIYFLIVNALGKIALIKAISLNGQVGIKDLISQSKPLIGKYLALQFLVGLITVVGFILLFVPGIIFMIWYLFASIVLIIEGQGVKASLKQSKFYVKGKFWGILLRLFLLILVISLFAGLSSLIDNQIFDTIIQLLSTFVIAPIASIYLFKLYSGAKAAA